MKSVINQKKKLGLNYKQQCSLAALRPIKTRWSSWLKVVEIHSKSFDKCKIVFGNIKKQELFKSAATKASQEQFNKPILKAKIDFINSISWTIIDAIIKKRRNEN